jgi:hypothetical protein
MTTPLLSAAKELTFAGISCLPLRADKRPNLQSWQHLQTQLPKETELNYWFGSDRGQGIGLVCGQVQVLDVDTKHCKDGHTRLVEALHDYGEEWFLESAVVQRTVSGGYHYCVRIQETDTAKMPPNLKLACAEGQREAYLETRGFGGYIAIEPTPGYKLTQGRFGNLPTITLEQWHKVLAVCSTLDCRPPAKIEHGTGERQHTEDSPGADYSANGGLSELARIIEPQGWQSRDGRFWTRPGKRTGCSATWDHDNSRRFYVFTSSTELENGRGYDLFGLRARIEFGGDLAACARQLAAEGWGASKKQGQAGTVADLESVAGTETGPTPGKIVIGGLEFDDTEPEHYDEPADERPWYLYQPEDKPKSKPQDGGGGAIEGEGDTTPAPESKPKPQGQSVPVTQEEIKRAAALMRLDKIIDASAIHSLTDEPPLNPILWLRDKDNRNVMAASCGNIQVLKAQSKSGKSHALAALMAAFIAGKYACEKGLIDTLGWVADNAEGKAVIMLDCEQSKHHSYRLFHKHALERAGVTQTPDWVLYYNLVGVSVGDIRPIIGRMLARNQERFGGTKYLIIDGYADLIKSVNDEEEAIALTSELMAHSVVFDCGICGVLHENTGQEGGKMRGHVGSQIERKAETIFAIDSDKSGLKSLYIERPRNEPLPKNKALKWQWNEEAGGFRLVDKHALEEIKINAQAEAKLKKAREDWDRLDEARKALDAAGICNVPTGRNELARKIAEALGMSEDTGKNRIALAIKVGFAAKASDDGAYIFYSVAPPRP